MSLSAPPQMVEGRPFVEWLDAQLMTASADHEVINIPGTSMQISVAAARTYIQTRMLMAMEQHLVEAKTATLMKMEEALQMQLAIRVRGMEIEAKEEEAFAAKARECAERHT